jgi:hypothetical protein
MAFAAFVHMIETFSITFPYVLAILVNMVTIGTLHRTEFFVSRMCFVTQGYWTFLIFFVAFILDGNRIGNNLLVGRNKRTSRDKNQAGKNRRKENTESFDHLGFTSFLDEFLCL